MPVLAQLQRRRSEAPVAQKAASRSGHPAVAQLAEAMNARPHDAVFQKASEMAQAPDRTGLPPALRGGIEALSGFSLDPVRVHYNSAEPKRFGADAITQGNRIDVGPGQERHLPHEAWHVVQQMQGRVSTTAQMHGVALNDDPALEAEADHMGGRALQMHAAAAHAPLRSTLLATTSATPVQGAWTDYLPSWETTWNATKAIGTGALVGTALATTGLVGLPLAIGIGGASALATHLGGVGAGLGAGALGLGGVALGGALPLIGGTTTSVLGGTVGTLFGGTIGADTQSMLMPPKKKEGKRIAPSIGEVITSRAIEKALKIKKDVEWSDVYDQLDDKALKKFVVTQKPGSREDLAEVITYHYEHTGKKADFGTKIDSPTRDAVRTALKKNSFVKKILDGSLFKTGVKKPALSLAKKSSSKTANTAVGKFNALVRRNKELPQISNVETGYRDPVSYMSDSGKLTVGWGSPSDTIVHEFGHHLENNLEPSEFGTLHNFLRARSKSGKFRKVGYGSLLNKELKQEGYDTETPNPDVGGHSSITRLGVDMLRMGVGMKSGEESIDRFVQQNAHTSESSYATQVYEGTGFRTEFLATTIHYLANPKNALALIDADPLRACLFLYFAQRGAYEQVKSAVEKKGIDLDKLIHRLN